MKEFEECVRAMDEVGVVAAQRQVLWKVLAAVLLLGEIDFGTGENAELAGSSKTTLGQVRMVRTVGRDTCSWHPWA